MHCIQLHTCSPFLQNLMPPNHPIAAHLICVVCPCSTQQEPCTYNVVAHLWLRRIEGDLNVLDRFSGAQLRLQGGARIPGKISAVRAPRLLPQQVCLDVDLPPHTVLSRVL